MVDQSQYQDNLHLQTLFRGGSMLWLNMSSTTATASSPAEPLSDTGCPGAPE